MYRLIFTAPVVPAFPKPSSSQELVPKFVGPLEGSPSPAWSQQAFGGNPPLKSSKFGGAIATQGVVKR